MSTGKNLKLIRKGMKTLVKAGMTESATLTKVTPGTRTPGAISGGTNATTADYKAAAIVSQYDDDDVDGTLILRSDRRIVLLAVTIGGKQVPEPGDRITLIDRGETYTIQKDGITSDAAQAQYTCQGRR